MPENLISIIDPDSVSNNWGKDYSLAEYTMVSLSSLYQIAQGIYDVDYYSYFKEKIEKIKPMTYEQVKTMETRDITLVEQRFSQIYKNTIEDDKKEEVSRIIL